MITVKLLGGLGNQLFCYALGRSISLNNNCELQLDTINGFTNDKYKRTFGLNKYNIAAETYQNQQKNPNKYFLKSLKLLNQKFNIKSNYYLLEEKQCYNNILSGIISKSLYLDGYWQSPLYFDKYKEQIKLDLTLQKEPDDLLNSKAIEIIRSKKNTVCIHARRLRNQAADGTVVSSSDSKVLSIEFYRKAIERIYKKVDNPFFIFFGDDTEWMINNLQLKESIFVADFNKGDENNYKDLWLMSNCNHFIIANSTFSWWGAWLGEIKGKSIVIVPEISSWDNQDILPLNWISI